MEESIAETSYQLFHVLRFSSNYGMLRIKAKFLAPCSMHYALCVEHCALCLLRRVYREYFPLFRVIPRLNLMLRALSIVLFLIVPHIINIHTIAAAHAGMRLRCGNEQIIVFAQGKSDRE